MSTGQISSRVGDSASNPAENSPETVQTVNPQGETLISSSNGPENTAVESSASPIPPLIIQVPDFIAGYATSKERADKLRGALAFMGKAAIDRDMEECGGKSGRNYLDFIVALSNVVYSAEDAYKVSQETPKPTVEPEATPDPTAGMRPREREEYLKMYLPKNVFRLSDPDKSESITIISDLSFFHTITSKDFLGEAIQHLSCWYGGYSAMDQDDKDALPIDQVRTTAFFGEIIQFLADMIPEVAQKEWQKGSDWKEKVFKQAYDKVSEKEVAKWVAICDKYQEAFAIADETRAAMTETIETKGKIIKALEAEVNRLRDQYEPVTSATEGGANE